MNNIFLAQSQPSIPESGNENSAEIELLLCCARTHIETDIEKRIKLLLQQDIDWTYLCETSSHHGVMPLLYQSLKNICSEAVPENILSRLRFYSQANDLRNYYLYEELIEILHKLKTEGITTIPFKGPLLSIIAYQKLSLRQFSDLDILVKKDDFLKAKKILNRSGFQAINDLKILDPQEEKLYFQEIDEFTLINTTKKIDIICDLHQVITVSSFRKCKIELSKIHEQLEDISFNEHKIYTIKPDYLLILLCIHASKHFWCQLNWICDINELIISCKEINWEESLSEATNLGCRYHFLLGLSLSNYYLGTEIPQNIQLAIKRSLRVKFLSKYFKERIFSSSDIQLKEGFNITNFIYQLLLTNGWQAYGEILEYFIAPSTKDKLIFDFPRWLDFLYYFVRPFRLIYKLIKRNKSTIFREE